MQAIGRIFFLIENQKLKGHYMLRVPEFTLIPAQVDRYADTERSRSRISTQIREHPGQERIPPASTAAANLRRQAKDEKSNLNDCCYHTPERYSSAEI